MSDDGNMAFCRIALLLLLILVSDVEGQTNGQVQAYRSIDSKTCGQIIDLVFPPMKPISRDVVFTISVRAFPAFDPASQLLITYFTKRPPLVDYAVADKQICEAANHGVGKVDPVAVARGISVRHQVPNVSRARVLEWQQGLFQSLEASLPGFRRETEELERSGTVTVGLDNTSYEIGYAQASFHGGFDLSRQDPAIAEWAKAVSDEVRSYRSGR
jgi:hypothetical protein